MYVITYKQLFSRKFTPLQVTTLKFTTLKPESNDLSNSLVATDKSDKTVELYYAIRLGIAFISIKPKKQTKSHY